MPKSKSHRFILPDAAKLLGTLLRTLNVSLPKRRRESVRKYLDGARPLGTGMLEAVVTAVVDAGYVPDLGNVNGIGTTDLVTGSLVHAVVSWDQVVGHARPLHADANVRATATRYLRLAALDFAIRAAAFDVLHGNFALPACFAPEAEVPAWSRKGGLREMLRALPQSLGTKRSMLSRTKRFDDLLDGRGRPSLAKIEQFSAALAEHDTSRTSMSALHLGLLWVFALDALCNKIARVIGRGAVENIACAFRRVRSNTRRILLASERRASASYRRDLRNLFVVGARASEIEPVIDKLVRGETRIDELLSAVLGANASRASASLDETLWSKVPERAAWAMDLRACHVDWTLSEFSSHISRAPVTAEDIPLETALRLLHAFRADAAPSELASVCAEHPSAMRWASRMLVQQAFVRGAFERILPMVARFADAIRDPSMYFEAAIVHAAARKPDDALAYIDAIGNTEPFATTAKPIGAVLRALSGRHADALEQLDPFDESNGAIAYARGIALRGVGRVENALEVFEAIIAEIPTHALALEQAARCCDELARSARGKDRARWTTTGNRYAKSAAQYGRSIAATGKGRKHRVSQR